LSSATLIVYVSKGGATTVSLYDHSGMLLENLEMRGVSHVSVVAERCSLNVSLAEFDSAVMLRVSGSITYKQVSNVLEVRCVGS